jgi:penicillin V acylase-like amidase (Ntn superfamily)
MNKRWLLTIAALSLLLTNYRAPLRAENSAPQGMPAASSDRPDSCTSFCLDNAGHPVFGANYDHHISEGLVFVNKRNVAKTSWEPSTTGHYAEWVARYGSVTFSLAGYQMAWAGMNEAGLVISTMALSPTESPAPDERPPLAAGFWMQYVLDTCATVQEVIATDAVVRIADVVDHYLVCDATGECAVLEFLGGEMVCHTGKDLPVKALTNNTYVESVRWWQRPRLLKWLDRLLKRPEPSHSLLRFETAAESVRSFQRGAAQPAVEYAFDTLRAASSSATQWSIVFDIYERQVLFRTKSNTWIRQIDFSALDFSCESPVRMLDIHEKWSGDVTDDLVEYSHQANLDHMTQALAKWGVQVSQETLEDWVHHVENFACVE